MTERQGLEDFDIISIKMKGRGAITNYDLNSYEVNGIMKSKITTSMYGSVTLKREGIDNETEACSPEMKSKITTSMNGIMKSKITTSMHAY